MSRSALFLAAKNWDLATVRRLLTTSPALAFAAEANGRLAIHVCAKRSWPLHRAAEQQGLATLQALIAAGTPPDVIHPIPDEREIFPGTPLWYAVAHGANPLMVRHLLGLGARPDHCLHAAVWNDDAEILQLLLDAGAPVDGPRGSTPLLYAARLGRATVIPLLIAAGASLDAVGYTGRNAAKFARLKKIAPELLALLQR